MSSDQPNSNPTSGEVVNGSRGPADGVGSTSNPPAHAGSGNTNTNEADDLSGPDSSNMAEGSTSASGPAAQASSTNINTDGADSSGTQNTASSLQSAGGDPNSSTNTLDPPYTRIFGNTSGPW
jgi:hypothetical protein